MDSNGLKGLELPYCCCCLTKEDHDRYVADTLSENAYLQDHFRKFGTVITISGAQDIIGDPY